MVYTIISKELSSSGLVHPDGLVMNFSNPDQCIEILDGMNKDSLEIYDITENIKLNHEESIFIKDQVNCTGSNPLVGRQEKMGIDFIDMSNVFVPAPRGVVTHSCGAQLSLEFEFPSHYFAHIVIIARAFNFERIAGRLINNNKTYEHSC
ncbi:hypothetical protein N9263_01370 [Candidatus Marinimicrobia bacterium]|nr:hypothetical protein [Candidatus Neomarinimicrobiota bacterium]